MLYIDAYTTISGLSTEEASKIYVSLKTLRFYNACCQKLEGN